MKRLLRDPIMLVFHMTVALVFLGSIGVIVSHWLTQDTRFREDGLATQATVTELWQTSELVEGTRSRMVYFYFARVDYDIEGQAMSAEAGISGRFFEETEKGDTLSILYLTSDPSVVQIDPKFQSRELGALATIAFMLAIAALWRIYQRSKRNTAAITRPSAPSSSQQVLSLPRWFRYFSSAMAIAFLASFFTVSPWLARSVEAATWPWVGFLSSSLAFVAWLLPPISIGLTKLASEHVFGTYREPDMPQEQQID